MAKANWNEYDSTASNNTVVDDINIAEGCPPSGINNAIREIMAHTADVVAGTTALARLKVDSVDINGTTIGHVDDTDLLTLADGSLTVAGTVELGHATDTTLARASAGNLTVEGNELYRAGGTDIPVADGGTGRSTLTANYVLLGNGTTAVQMIAPGADGQVLTSTGSTWQSEAASSGPDQATQAEIEGQSNVDKYIPPDLLKHGPSSCKAWAYVSRGGGTPTLGGPSYNMTSVTDDGDSQTIMTIATDFSSVTYSPTACMIADSTSFAYVHTVTAGSFKVKVCNDGGGSEDNRDFACQAFGDQA